MATIEKKVLDSVNKPGRVGVLATADAQGRPNVAYFGSPHLNEDGTLVMGLSDGRTLANLEANPLAAFLTIESAPVRFDTPGWRLYLKAKAVQRQGPVLDAVRQAIAQHAGEKAAQMIVAGVAFDVTAVRPLVDMG